VPGKNNSPHLLITLTFRTIIKTMKKLPIGIQTFRKFNSENYLYIDKTKGIYQLLSEGNEYYFLSRPRRFGKSLLVSILKEIFSGNKELFKGLWIYDKLDWQPHPVIHLDFLGLEYEGREQLIQTLEFLVDQNANAYGVQLNQKGYDKRFKELIIKLSAENRVVILVDEYDKPIIDYVENQEIKIAKENRKVLKTFYGAIKGADEYLAFVFITGVSKFSKVSIFSGLNNLRDITMSASFSTLLGYTEDELQVYFKEHMTKMAGKLEITPKALMQRIRKWYNGYSWDGENFVYNPLSILSLFSENSFENFWFSTGTPTFLTRLIKNKQRNISQFDNLPVSSYTFDSYDIENMDVTSLLFQTGYLTVKEIFFKKEKKKYRLSYPNKEVRDSFLTYLFQEYTEKGLEISSQVVERLVEAIDNDDLHRLMEEIKSLLASIPYYLFTHQKEAYYHTIIYLILRLAGAEIRSEESTNIGRIDAVMESEHIIYIFEFKMGDEREALEQIKRMKYAEKYMSGNKRIVLVGVGLNAEQRNIGNYVKEELR